MFSSKTRTSISFTSWEQPIRISNFYKEILVYLLFDFFYKVKVSIEVKMPIDLIMIKILKTHYLVKKPQKVNKHKFCCNNSRFVLDVGRNLF